jgi:hypothetical protein
MGTEQFSARMELIQTIIAMGDLQASHIAIYLTILFAYISVAYVAGNKLSRLQLGVTTFIFMAASVREVTSIVMLAQTITDFQIELALLDPDSTSAITRERTPFLYSIWWSIGVWSTGAFAALLFMWSVRRFSSS